MAIIYYMDKYERYKLSLKSEYLLPIGICATLAGTCMVADLVKAIVSRTVIGNYVLYLYTFFITIFLNRI